jgi:hypothetical protein
MECFHHAGTAAAGSCRACLKGLCRQCAIPLEGGLACPDGCEPFARALVRSLQQSVRLQDVSTGFLRSARGLWLGLTAVALFVGVFVVVWGVRLPEFREVALLGVPFLALALLAGRLARNIRSPGPSAEGGQESSA